MARKPLVALVGRPNVGKSTLFNRLVGERLAVTNPIPGTTRDRLHGESYWNGVYFRVVDTGGIEVYQPKGTRDENPLAEGSAQFIPLIRKQAMIAIEQAEVIILVVDIHHGITAADREITEILRRSSKPVVVAANKADDLVHGDDHFEFYALGVGEVVPCSAVHGVGVGDLLDEVIRVLPEGDWMDSSNRENEHMHIAIVGRPNAGKSTLVNKLIGEERVIVSPIPGTTRDAIDTEISWHGQPITLIDTAGIRRRGRVEPGVEQFSVIRAMNAIERCDVAVLVVDAIEGVTEQDEHIAGYVIDQYKSLVVIINKWDAVEKESTTMLRFDEEARKRLHFVPYVTFIYISALTGQRIHQVLEAANRVYETRHFRIPTSEVNRILRAAIQHHPPTTRGTRRLKIYFGSQVRIAPPVILFHANDRSLVHFTYRRYLENSIRDKFAFEGTPIRLSFRSAQSAPRSDNGVSVTMARDDEADADLDIPDYEYFMSNEDEQDSFVEFDAAARDQAVDSEGYYTDAPDDEEQA